MGNHAPSSRTHLPVRLYALGEQPGDDLSATTTAEERLAVVWPLTVQAWTLSGRSLPNEARHRLPVRLVPLAVARAKAEP